MCKIKQMKWKKEIGSQGNYLYKKTEKHQVCSSSKFLIYICYLTIILLFVALGKTKNFP